MAKVNLWLRGARGKFAGASLAKGTDGETIAREVVTPSNPNTDKQLYQRMIMATVMAAYSAGKEIFDHSFQGRKVGAECQQEFMQRNLLSLRTHVSQDLTAIQNGEKTEKNCETVIVGPKTRTPAPGRFLVSDGTYQQTFFFLKSNTMGYTLGIRPSLENDSIEKYAKRNGLIPGDIYTLVAFSVALEDDPVWIGINAEGKPSIDAWDYQQACHFQFWRLQVKDSVLDDKNTFTYNAPGALAKLFNLTDMRALDDTSSYRLLSPVADDFKCSDGTSEQDAPLNTSNLQYDFNIGSYGIIRSRYDQDLRSTTQMKMWVNNPDPGFNKELMCGISAGTALRQWRAGVETLGASNLILESNS